jgi:hypothetical protein
MKGLGVSTASHVYHAAQTAGVDLFEGHAGMCGRLVSIAHRSGHHTTNMLCCDCRHSISRSSAPRGGDPAPRDLPLLQQQPQLSPPTQQEALPLMPQCQQQQQQRRRRRQLVRGPALLAHLQEVVAHTAQLWLLPVLEQQQRVAGVLGV